MTSTSSRGLHLSTGTQYLIEEGLVASSLAEQECSTEIFVTGDNEQIEEEIAFTKTHVVWSRGNSVRAVYGLGLEGEDIQQALFTCFNQAVTRSLQSSVSSTVLTPPSVSDGVYTPAHSSFLQDASEPLRDVQLDDEESRALVVVLLTKVHVYMLHGSHHVVDLPFPIRRAFPMKHGILLQRLPREEITDHATPEPPAPPYNSFFSSQQTIPASSFLHSPMLSKSLGASRSKQNSQTQDGEGLLNSLWKNIQSPSAEDTVLEDEDSLFTLTDPLAELGVVTQVQKGRSHLLAKSRGATKAAFETIDSAEKVIHVSNRQELLHVHSGSDLVLIITENAEQQTLTIWHGWYLHDEPLHELMQHQKQQKDEKARRRSSFFNTSIGTGATTPAARHRQSFANLTGTHAGRSGAQSHHEEVEFASQLDPDFTDNGMQLQGKGGNRRISSIVSRGELGTNDQRPTHAGGPSNLTTANARRNASLGLNDRRSLGLRRSRASTPGSVLSRSHIATENDMDLDSGTDQDDDELLADALDEIRAVCKGVHSGFLIGVLDEGWKQDFVMRRIHSFDLATPKNKGSNSKEDMYGTFTTCLSPLASKSHDGAQLNLHILDKTNEIIYTLDLLIRQCKLSESPESTALFPVPLVRRRRKQLMAKNALKIVDGSTQTIIINGNTLLFPGHNNSSSMLQNGAYHTRNPLGLLNIPSNDVDVGKGRILPPPQEPALSDAGLHGTYSETEHGGRRHRRQVQLAPSDSLVQSAIKICELMLPDTLSYRIRQIWHSMHMTVCSQPQSLEVTACNPEWIALAATIFYLSLGMIDQKSIAAAKVARIATGKHPVQTTRSTAIQQCNQVSDLVSKGPWSVLANRTTADNRRVETPEPAVKADQALLIALIFADEHREKVNEPLGDMQATLIMKLLLGLHILREEQKLNVCGQSQRGTAFLACLVAQLGAWLNLEAWSYAHGSYYCYEGASESRWAFVRSAKSKLITMEVMEVPIGVMEWLEHSFAHRSAESYPSLMQVAIIGNATTLALSVASMAAKTTPRITMMSQLLETTNALTSRASDIVEAMANCGMTRQILESLPTGIVSPFREAISQCERDPPLSWSPTLLELVGREDMDRRKIDGTSHAPLTTAGAVHDLQSICLASEQAPVPTKTREADRNAVSQLIFRDDRRLLHAANILHFNTVQIAECAKQPEWSDASYFEQQRRVMQFVTIRTLALPVGDGMLHFDSQSPLMTERYHLPGFNASCIMQPAGHTVTNDRSGLTEDKVSWAYFHAGASTGLRISRQAVGIDTSWLMFNKPQELTNRHAGLLLALGLNGHLKNVAKWLSFKYLTPKHTMTSLGLLLGLAASNIGTMNSLITRMLSVHITCMLPPGAAELNVSPLTQTAGLLGIGLLYHNTQHRRMSETMLHEIETMGVEDPDNGPDALRDESYRLAAGLSLGLINLGHGHKLQGLHGMQLEARLLRIAVGARPVRTVHVFDKATAGSIMALALVFMKTKDEALARKIDVPDTEQQFEYVRPDMLMLRSMAKHLILWDTIQTTAPADHDNPQANWIPNNVPACCKTRWTALQRSDAIANSADLPFFYIITGLAWAITLKYAGSGNKSARNEVLAVLDLVWQCLRKRSDGNYFYDSKSVRTGLRRCVDVLTLFTATIMAGTGDIQTFRYLRRLHGKTDSDTLYGSHLASHMGIGMLFLGSGTLAIGTSNLAIAALICSLYPLFPTDVQDNRVHLQAFRHLWVFAVESRCLVAEDIDTGRPIHIPLSIQLKDESTLLMQAPCLLPDIKSIVQLSTTGTSYWPISLDLSSEAASRAQSVKIQKIFVKRCPPSVVHDSVFWSSFAAATVSIGQVLHVDVSLQWIVGLRALRGLEQGDFELIVPRYERNVHRVQSSTTKIDDRLVLKDNAEGSERNGLWDLRGLFAWAEQLPEEQQKTMRWLGWEVVQTLRCRIEERQRQMSGPRH